MANAKSQDLHFIKQYSDSLVDFVFFGNGGTQWLEQTRVYDQCTNIPKNNANACKCQQCKCCQRSRQRLYNRKCLNDLNMATYNGEDYQQWLLRCAIAQCAFSK